MKNKVLIKLIVPELDSTFDVFIPVNEVVWKVKKLIIKSLSDLTGGAIDASKSYTFINKYTGESYSNNAIVINTDIRNTTEIVLLSVKNSGNTILNVKVVQ